MKKWKLASVVLVLVLLATGSFTIASAGEPDEKLLPVELSPVVLDASLSEVSTVFDIPKANLEVATSRAFSFGADKFLLSSIVDKKSKQAYMVSTDEHGKVWIAEPKIEGELVDYMSQMKPEETVIVSIWAIYVRPEEELWQIPSKYPDVPFEGYRPALGADVSPEVLDAIEADVREIKLRANEEAVQPVVDFLQSTGSTIIYVSKYSPTVDAELSKNDVYKLARLPEVESISLPPEEPEPCLDTAAYTIKADEVWDEGYDGGLSNGPPYLPPYYQTYVAVIDYGIDFSHPALAHTSGHQFKQFQDIYDWSYHGTMVAGCVASIDETYRGIAYGTRLMDANFSALFPSWSYCKDACEWAHACNADLYNLSWSWGTAGWWDVASCRYFDHIAYEWNRLPVCAAGNNGLTSEYVSSPANAWNVLAVGGINDGGTADWSNDSIYSSSSWKNPRTPHDDREKPEVCAPAVSIRTTKVGGGFGSGSGTSLAAPQVAGIAALLIEKNSSLKNYPELLKAIIMATANHNVDNDFPWEQEDDDDGVGTVNAWEAYKCVDQEWTWSGDKVEADLPFDIPFYARAGETVRFVINWLAHTDYYGSGDYGLCADLKLDILGGPYYPYWYYYYGTSNSYDSAWEVVQFTAPYSGTYYARVSAPNHGEGDPWAYNGAESIAAAWYRSSEVTTLELLPEADSTSLPPPWYVIEEFSDISDLTFHGMGSPTNPLGILTFTTGYDPYYYKTGLSINSEVYDLVKIRAKSAVGGGSTAQIFWTNDEGSWSEIRSQYFTIVSDGEFHVYEIDLSEHAHWLGTCTGFRHDPVLPSGVDCEVDWIMIYGGGDGADHDLTATVYDQFGYGMEDIAVTWSISGVGSFSGTPESTTDTNGEADAVITSSVPGTSTVRCEVTGNPSVYDTATNDWTYTPKVTTVELLPETGENPVGTTHDLTATVYDQFGYEMEGVGVTWSITGVGSFSGTPEIVTDADGQADAVITSSVPGTSTVRCKAQMAIILIFPGPEIDPPVYGTATKDWAYLEDFEWGLEFNGSSDHVNLPFSDNFSAFTIEFWMKSSDTTNSGTPISMSDGTQHNEILLYNYNNFNLYIEGSNTGSTGVSANDGNWHHIAWTWQSSDGGTKLFKDGIEVYSGTIAPSGIPITNPSFESGTTGWSPAGYGTISSDSTKHVYGSYSLKVDVSGGTYKAFFQNPSDLEGKTITVGGWVWSDTPNSAQILIMDYVSSYETVSSDYHPGDSQWHFLTATKTIREGIVLSSSRLVRGQVSGDGNLAYFDDFILVEGDNIDAGAPNPTNIIIGQEQDSYGGGFQAEQAFLGEMDEIRIWDDVRTQTEIQVNMYSELTGNESGLVGYWKFNEGEGSIVYDTSGNGNHGTIFPACLEYALEFNDPSNYVNIPFQYQQRDDFEWGSDGDPLSDSKGDITWSIIADGDSKVEIDTGQHYEGAKSARLYRDADNNARAYFSQAAITPTQTIEFWFRKDDASYVAFWHGDGTHYIRLTMHLNEHIYYYDGDSHDTGAILLINTWYLIGIRNVNWEAATYDIYLNNSLIKSGATMTSSSSYSNAVHFISTVANSEVWLDCVQVSETLSAFTIEFWMKTSDTTNTGTPISCSDGTQHNEILLYNHKSFALYIEGSAIGTGISANGGNWHHLAWTWQSSDGETKLLKDGVEVYSGTLKAGGAPNPANLIVGQEQDAYGGGFDITQAFLGEIDDIRIWDDVRTQTEIQDNMYSELTGNESGLVGYWKFNEGEGSVVYDSAGDNDGTIESCGYVIEDFSNISDLTFFNMGTPTTSGGIMSFTSTTGDPCYRKTGLSIDSNSYNLVYIRAKSAIGGGTDAQVFWVNDEGSWSETRSQHFTIISDGYFHDYEIDLSGNSHWLGTCTAFRHDPFVVSGIAGEVDWIKFYGAGADWVQYSANWVLYIPS